MKRHILIIAALFSLSFVFSESVFAGAEDDSFKAAVEDIFTSYCSTSMKKDADAWTELWDEEGVKMVPNLPSIYGKSAIGEVKRKKSQTPDELTMIIKVEDAQLADEFGFAHGTYSTSVTPKGGGAAKHKVGKFLTVFKKQTDGSWKIYRDSVSPNQASK